MRLRIIAYLIGFNNTLAMEMLNIYMVTGHASQSAQGSQLTDHQVYGYTRYTVHGSDRDVFRVRYAK